MDKDTHSKLFTFLQKIDSSAELREQFIGNPIKTLSHELEIDSPISEDHLGLANQLLLSALAKNNVLESIKTVSQDYQLGKISEDEKIISLAKLLIRDAPIDVKNRLEKIWGTDEISIEKIRDKGPTGLVNLYVAANETAVVNHFAVHQTEVAHSTDYFFSGAHQAQEIELKKIANILTQSK
jgi:hypothetical protein